MVFLLAGSSSQIAFLGHQLDKSFKGDIETYLRGIDRPEGLKHEEARPLLTAGRRDADALLTANTDAVARVRDLLLSRVPSDSAGRYIDFGQPLHLPYDAVRAAVLNAA